MIHAYAAKTAGGKLEPYDYEPGLLKDEEVEIKVEYCGICHSDLGLLKNDWGFSQCRIKVSESVATPTALQNGT